MLMIEDKFHIYKTDCMLSDYSEFGRDNEGDDDYGTEVVLIDEVVGWGRASKQEYSYASGCTKAVIINGSSSVVLKVPFSGQWYVDYDWEDEDREDQTSFSQFEGSPSAEGWNYCEAEMEIYEHAVEDGFGEYFAKTEFYGTTKYGYPLYTQEACNFYSNEKTSEESRNQFSKMEREGSAFCNYEWGTTFIERYGIEAFKELGKYINRMGIRDLHSGNLGYRKSDGAPVLTDTSGYDC